MKDLFIWDRLTSNCETLPSSEWQTVTDYWVFFFLTSGKVDEFESELEWSHRMKQIVTDMKENMNRRHTQGEVILDKS